MTTFEALGCTERERSLFAAACEAHASEHERVLGRVIKLDRGFPLVCYEDASCASACDAGSAVFAAPKTGLCRAEHAVAFIKRADSLACVGDWVVLALPDGHDKGVIDMVLDRKQAFVRKDPAEKTGMQVLAANVDTVFVLHALSNERLNVRRLERELVVAYESGAMPVVVLTKADLATTLNDDLEAAREVAFGLDVIVESTEEQLGVEEIRAHIPAGSTAVLLGSSGVGKSSLVNALLGRERLATGSVRKGDDKGRHTTVARELVCVPDGGVIIDTPGIRALALWDSDEGVAATFPEIDTAAARCRFRDCTHTTEPGCAVIAAVETGEISARRLQSYRDLQAEMVELTARQEIRARLDKKRAGKAIAKDIKRHYNTADKYRGK